MDAEWQSDKAYCGRVGCETYLRVQQRFLPPPRVPEGERDLLDLNAEMRGWTAAPTRMCFLALEYTRRDDAKGVYYQIPRSRIRASGNMLHGIRRLGSPRRPPLRFLKGEIKGGRPLSNEDMPIRLKCPACERLNVVA